MKTLQKNSLFFTIALLTTGLSLYGAESAPTNAPVVALSIGKDEMCRLLLLTYFPKPLSDIINEYSHPTNEDVEHQKALDAHPLRRFQRQNKNSDLRTRNAMTKKYEGPDTA